MAFVLFLFKFSTVTFTLNLISSLKEKRMKKENITVRLLEYDRSETNQSKSIGFKVMKVIVHEKYASARTGDDIALLRLDTKVIFSPTSKIRPVCLPKRCNVTRTL